MAGGHNRGSEKVSIIAAFIANLGIAIAKLVAFVVTGSASMLAESLHSLADTGNQGLLLLGGRLSRRKSTPEHQFGYGQSRYFWAFVVALVLFALGGVFSIVEAIRKFVEPGDIESPVVAFVVLGIAMVLEAGSFTVAVRSSKAARSGKTWWQFIRRSKSPELPVVLLEDSGALLGLVFATTGLALATATGDSRWDALGSAAIGILLVAIAVVLAVETHSLLIGESASDEHRASILEALQAAPEIVAVFDLRTMHIGPEDLMVAARIGFDSQLTSAQVASVVDNAHARIAEAVQIARRIYLEPEIIPQ
jgi:cation diffusion facilitator family transporter